MPAFLNRFDSQIHGLLRIVVGLLFLCHGAQKVFGVFGGVPAGAMPDAARIGIGLLELIGGGFVMVGLFTRWTAFILSGMMAVAYFGVHQKDGLFPIQNHGELAALYSWVFLFFAARGGGALSIDGARDK